MPNLDPAHPITLERIEVGGRCIAYRRAGAGPPLVLLHGGACDGRVWARQLRDLSSEFSVVAWDAPGCGGSSDPPEAFRLADYADCLAGFIGALGLRRPHVLGHSFGGGLALELFGRHPQLPRTLVLAGAYAGWAGSLPPGEVQRRLRAALALAEQGPGPTGAVPGLHPIGTRVMAAAFAAADLRPVLPLIDVPTLLLHGEADERAPREVAAALHAGIPGSELIVLPGAGHESHQEAPELFNTAVRRFLSSIRG